MKKLDEIICPRCGGYNTQNTDDHEVMEGDDGREYQELWYCYDCDVGWLNLYRLAEQRTDGIEGPSWVQ